MRGAGLLCLVLAAACAGPAADHERLGDAAYNQGDWVTARQEYEAAATSPHAARVYAKIGAAALHGHEYTQAADAYRRLAEVDPTRQAEAGRGLERVAQAADRDEVPLAVEQALNDLRIISPERMSARHTLGLFRSGRLQDAEAVGLGVFALAAAGDAATVDQVLVQYGGVLRGTLACEDASQVYLAALRRSHEAEVHRKASQGFGLCGIQLGQQALTLQKPEVAAQWFGRVVAADSLSEAGRRGLVGLGDARVALGDILGASFAFQDALRRSDPPDSISVMATQRLNALGAAATADSPWVSKP